jgi:hypothetical protein
MADCVDAAVKHVEPAHLETPVHRVFTEAELSKL